MNMKDDEIELEHQNFAATQQSVSCVGPITQLNLVGRHVLLDTPATNILDLAGSGAMAGEEEQTMLENEITSYREAFTLFDWNKNGRVPYSYLLDAMRRAGANPTESEVQDIVNKLEMNNDALTADDFCRIMLEVNQEVDTESSYKETFRAFSKDEDGCIPAEEVKFVLKLLPVGFDIHT